MTESHYTLDDNLSLKAAALVAASAAGSLIRDVGAGFVAGDLVVDVSALEVATGDESYDIVLQGSPDAAFGTAANIQDLMAFNLGAATPKRTDSDKADVTGRYVLPFRNEFGGTTYRYLRIYTVVAGTIATGINYAAWLAVHKD
jgi:hypothetical protein